MAGEANQRIVSAANGEPMLAEDPEQRPSAYETSSHLSVCLTCVCVRVWRLRATEAGEENNAVFRVSALRSASI